MTEREWLVKQLVQSYPENKQLPQDSLDNMGVKELLHTLRQWNAARNHGELNEQFKEWILQAENSFCQKIAQIYKVGNHKVQLVFYGMTYTILKYKGCYLRGKRSIPISITYSMYCDYLNINKRLNSNNVRKVIADDFYGHNYWLSKDTPKVCPTLRMLEPVFEELVNEIDNTFFL